MFATFHIIEMPSYDVNVSTIIFCESKWLHAYRNEAPWDEVEVFAEEHVDGRRSPCEASHRYQSEDDSDDAKSQFPGPVPLSIVESCAESMTGGHVNECLRCSRNTMLEQHKAK